MSGQGKLNSVTMIREFLWGEEVVGNVPVPNYKLVHGKSTLRCNSSPRKQQGGSTAPHSCQIWHHHHHHHPHTHTQACSCSGLSPSLNSGTFFHTLYDPVNKDHKGIWEITRELATEEKDSRWVGWDYDGALHLVCIWRARGILSSLKKGNPAVRDTRNEPWGHCAEWNKPATEEQAQCDSTCMRNLKHWSSQKQRAEWSLPEAGVGKGGMESYYQRGIKISVLQDPRICCMTSYGYLTILYCSLKNLRREYISR